MLTTKKIIGFAAATIVAGTLAAGAAGAANAGVPAPTIDSLPTAEIQNIYHPGASFRRCRGFRRALPRRIIYRRLMRQGYTRIRNLRRLSYVGGWRRISVYRATASRRFSGPFRSYRLRINGCTGRVMSARRIGFGYGWGYRGF